MLIVLHDAILQPGVTLPKVTRPSKHHSFRWPQKAASDILQPQGGKSDSSNVTLHTRTNIYFCIYVCIRACVYIYIFIFIYIYIYLFTYLFIFIFIYLYLYLYLYVYLYYYVYLFLYNYFLSIFMCTYTAFICVQTANLINDFHTSSSSRALICPRPWAP